MESWSRFLDTFFNWEVIERYFPAIMKGVVVTIEIAAAVVVTGTLLGLALAIMRTFRLLAVNDSHDTEFAEEMPVALLPRLAV